MERLIGTYGNPDSETLLVFVGGMHGNEPEGPLALERIFAYLHERQTPFKGYCVGLRGNVTGLRAQERYQRHDLNRIWTEDNLETARARRSDSPEFAEMLDLHEAIDRLGHERYARSLLVDLHCTSAEGGTFVVTNDLTRTGYVSKHLHAPIVVGLERGGKGLRGTLVAYWRDRDLLSLAAEGGAIGNPETVENLVWYVWETFRRSGCVAYADLPAEAIGYGERLEAQTAPLSTVMEVTYRHTIRPEDGFRMKPGFRNFAPVSKDELLGWDAHGEVRAPRSGFVLMPLYQASGEEGFLLVRKTQEKPMMRI